MIPLGDAMRLELCGCVRAGGNAFYSCVCACLGRDASGAVRPFTNRPTISIETEAEIKDWMKVMLMSSRICLCIHLFIIFF